MNRCLEVLVETIRAAKNEGRHDGLGKPIISIDLFYETALVAADEIERLQAIVDPLEQLREPMNANLSLSCDLQVNHLPLSSVRVSDDWTHGKPIWFDGETLAEALANALKAREAARKGQVQ